MKTFKTLLVIALFLFSLNGIQAQTSQTKLNQVELMKQFIGKWEGEVGKDTLVVGENKVFGNGLVCSSQVVVKGRIINSVQQLFGYDGKMDKFIIAELIESSPVIEICNTWFTSKNTGELIITNPENVMLKYKFEFKTPDMIVQTAFLDNKVVKEITLTRR